MNRCVCCRQTSFTLLKTQRNGWRIKKCQMCGLVQVVPMPSRKAISALYFHDWEHFSAYQSQRPAHQTYFRQFLSYVLQKASKKRSLRLLDIGSATGILLLAAKEQGMSAVGVDVSHDAVSYCTKHGLTAYQGTLADVSARKTWHHVFDVVTACQVIEHERDPLTFFRTVARVLKPDGICIVTTPSHDTVWQKVMGVRWIGYQHPEHLFFFTPVTLQRFMETAGLTVALTRLDFSRPYSVGYAFRRLGDYIPGLRWFFRPFERLFQNVQISVPFNPWGDFLLIGRNSMV